MSTKKPQNRTKKVPESPAQATTIARPVSDKRLFWWLAAIAFALYAPTLGHGFVLDDLAVIEKNTFVQQGFAGIPKLFTTFYWEGYWNSNAGLYRPLSLVSFAVEWGISPNNPFIHHFVNVLLYALTVGLVYRVVRLLLPDVSHWVAFGTALLFAVHPMHTEVVANSKSRDEILCFLFFLLAFRQILRYGLTTFRAQFITATLFLLCLLSKEAGILFLPVFGLYALLFKRATVLSVGKQLLPLLLVTGGWLALHQWIIGHSVHERITYSYLDNSLVGCPDKAAQIATGIGILGRYVWKAVVPVRMSYDYSYNEIPCETFAAPLVWLSLAAFAGLLLIAVRFRKTQPVIAFGVLYFIFTIALASNVFTLIGTTMGDRLLYAPSFGVCLVITYVLFRLFKATNDRRAASPAFYILVVIAAAMGFLSLNRSRDWKSNETLFAADRLHSPNSARVHFNYATLRMQQLPEDVALQQTQLPEIIAAFERSLAIDSADQGAHLNLGVCYYRVNNYKRSILHSKAALKRSPNDPGVLNNIADAFFSAGSFDSCLTYYSRIIDLPQTDFGAFNRMGTAYFNLKAYPESIAIFKRGLKKSATNEEIRMNLANCYGASGQVAAARDAFLAVLEINPNNQQAIRFVVMTSQQLGDPAMAQKYAAMLQAPPNP